MAAISANNDRSIGELLAGAIDKVGREARSSIEDGSGLGQRARGGGGLKFDRGISPYFMNNAERQTAVLEDAAILLVDRHLASLQGSAAAARGSARSAGRCW